MRALNHMSFIGTCYFFSVKMRRDQIVAAWDSAHPREIHPARHHSEQAYWDSGEHQAKILAEVLPEGSTVLDFGCGDGRVAVPLHRLGYHVIAVDSSAAMLARLRETESTITTLLSDGSDLADQLDQRVDAVVCLAVLIHHDWTAGAELVSELHDCVRAGGLLVLDWPQAARPSERRRWNDVTTWSGEQQDRITNALGMQRVERGLPWSTFLA